MEDILIRYDIVVADCPWKYFNEKDNDPAMGGMVYSTMTQEELKNLPVSNIVAKDSLLFLWGTAPKLPECLEIMEAWGFKFVTMPFVWLKINPTGSVETLEKDLIIRKGIYSGLGHYTASATEYVLMGKRGKGLPRFRKDIKQTIISPRTLHSKKPEELQDRLELLFKGVDRLELFATRKRDGWLCLGNAINGKDITEELIEL